jgi:hypothetical protein
VLLRGSSYTLVSQRGNGALSFTPTNVLIFDHAELSITIEGENTIVRPLTKNAEEVCHAFLNNGGFAVVERGTEHENLRFIATNPSTMNPWIIDGTLQVKDLTLGDQDYGQ